MTVQPPGRPPTQFEIVKDQVGRVLDPRTARRLAEFKDGTLYVRAGEGARFLAWLVDFLVFVLGAGVGLVVVAMVDRVLDLSDDAVLLALLGVLLLVPLVYGLCYGNGRALGAVLTSTRLVRAGDGSRIGGKAWWAMLVRTLLMPLLVVVLLVDALGDGSGAGGSLVRTSIDFGATKRLHAAGFRSVRTAYEQLLARGGR